MADHDRTQTLALSRYLITSLVLGRPKHAPIKTGPALATLWLQAAFGGFYVCCAYLFPKIHPLCHFFSHDLIASQLRPSLHELRTTIFATRSSGLYREKKRTAAATTASHPSSPIPILPDLPNRGPNEPSRSPPKRKKRPQKKSSNHRFKSCLSNLIDRIKKENPPLRELPWPGLVLSCLVACNLPEPRGGLPFRRLPPKCAANCPSVCLVTSYSLLPSQNHTTTTQPAP